MDSDDDPEEQHGNDSASFAPSASSPNHQLFSSSIFDGTNLHSRNDGTVNHQSFPPDSFVRNETTPFASYWQEGQRPQPIFPIHQHHHPIQQLMEFPGHSKRPRVVPIYNEFGFIDNLPKFPPLMPNPLPFNLPPQHHCPFPPPLMPPMPAFTQPSSSLSFSRMFQHSPPSTEDTQPPKQASSKPVETRQDSDGVNIRFVSYGVIPLKLGQKIGNRGMIPDGYQGGALLFGEQWNFLCSYGHDLKVCPDGVERIPISFSLTHQTAGWTVTVTENEEQMMKRDLDGETVCNEVLQQALQRRMVDYENNIVAEKDRTQPNQAILRAMQRKLERVSFHSKNSSYFGARLFGLMNSAVRCFDNDD